MTNLWIDPTPRARAFLSPLSPITPAPSAKLGSRARPRPDASRAPLRSRRSQLYGEVLPAEEAEETKAEAQAGTENGESKQTEEDLLYGDAAGSGEKPSEAPEAPQPPPPGEDDEEEDEDFDVVLGEAAGGKEGGANEEDDEDDLDIVLNATAGGEAPPDASTPSAAPLTPASGMLQGAQGSAGERAAGAPAPPPATQPIRPAAPANSQFRWSRDGQEVAAPKPPSHEPGKVDGYTQMMHPNPTARPIWMPYVPPTEHKDAAFPSQAKPGQPIKLPGQTRVAPDEYKEFLSLGHGELFDVDLERVVEAPWRDVTAKRIDYFNYGLDEAGWKRYCEMVKKYRLEFGMQSTIDTNAWNYDSRTRGGPGRSGRGYSNDYNNQSDLPPELRAALQDTQPSAGEAAMGEGGPPLQGGPPTIAYMDPHSGQTIQPLSQDMLDRIRRQKDGLNANSRGGYRGSRGGFRGGYRPDWSREGGGGRYGGRGRGRGWQPSDSRGYSNAPPSDAIALGGGGRGVPEGDGGQTYASVLTGGGPSEGDNRGDRGRRGEGSRDRSRERYDSRRDGGDGHCNGGAREEGFPPRGKRDRGDYERGGDRRDRDRDQGDRYGRRDERRDERRDSRGGDRERYGDRGGRYDRDRDRRSGRSDRKIDMSRYR